MAQQQKNPEMHSITSKSNTNIEADVLLDDWDINNNTGGDAALIGSKTSTKKVRSSRKLGGRGSRRASREDGIGNSNTEGNTNDKEGPNMLTMLFIAVALATVFNMSKSVGSPDPATIIYKSDPGRVRYNKGSLRSSGVGDNNDDSTMEQQHQQQPNMMQNLHQQQPYGQQFQANNMQGPFMQNQQQQQFNNMAQQQQYQQLMMQQQQQQQQQQQPGGFNMFNPMQSNQQQPFIGGLPYNPPQGGGMNAQMLPQQLQQQQQELQAPVVETAGTVTDANAIISQEQQASPEAEVAPVQEDQTTQEADTTTADEATPAIAAVEEAAAKPQEEAAVAEPTTPLKFQLNGFKDAWDPPQETDQPVFWHIPKAGGSIVKDIMGTCHRFVQASEVGITEGHENDSKIVVVRPGGAPVTEDPSPFVNCDPTTVQGIGHCKELGLAESNVADFISASDIFELDPLFTPTARGRIFTVFRHPVDRAVSMFNFVKFADMEPNYNPEFAKMTIEEYAQGAHIENNWMTRQLSSFHEEGDVTEEHMTQAMDVIRRKFLVGLLSEKEKTMERFEKFFGWKYRVNPENQEKCRETFLTSDGNSYSKKVQEVPKEGDPIFDLLAAQNIYDIELYKYVASLFVEQEQFVAHLKDGFRSEGATCAKCLPPTFPPVAGSAGGGGTEVVAVDQSFLAAVPTDFELAGFKDVSGPFEDTDQPVFWHIPKAGGSTVKDIMGTCHRFTQASEAGIAEGHENDPKIAVVRPGGVPADQDPSPFVNCDPTTVQGIDHCKELGLAESNLADYMASPYVWELHKVFSPKAQGRLFTVFRHPVDRAVSMFFYIQIADWEPTYSPELAAMTVSEYAVSPVIENNWMVRTLTQAYAGEVGDEHLKVAKDIIKRKFLVGLLKEKKETMERVEKFFRFKFRVNPKNQETCREKLLTGGSNSNAANKQEKPKEGDESYALVALQNVFDIQLYEFIEEQFKEQASLFKDIPDGFRNVDASCAKCVPPEFPGFVA